MRRVVNGFVIFDGYHLDGVKVCGTVLWGDAHHNGSDTLTAVGLVVGIVVAVLWVGARHCHTCYGKSHYAKIYFLHNSFNADEANYE